MSKRLRLAVHELPLHNPRNLFCAAKLFLYGLTDVLLVV
jgi:hypothetical protein